MNEELKQKARTVVEAINRFRATVVGGYDYKDMDGPVEIVLAALEEVGKSSAEAALTAILAELEAARVRIWELEKPHEAFLAAYMKNWNDAMEEHRKLFQKNSSLSVALEAAESRCAELEARYKRVMSLPHPAEARESALKDKLDELGKAERMGREDIAANRCGAGCVDCGSFYTMTGYGKPWHRPGCPAANGGKP